MEKEPQNRKTDEQQNRKSWVRGFTSSTFMPRFQHRLFYGL